MAASLGELVRAQIAAAPECVAVTDTSTSLTYRELGARVARIAAGLRRRGIERGDCVAVLVSRSASLPAILLGIQQAGAAYVPLDPLYPPGRLRAILEDSGARLLLVDEAAPRALPSPGVATLNVHDLGPPDEDTHDGPRPGDLAYVIFTSGSTGRPKGVEITHGALAAFITGILERPGIRQDDRVLAATTICFDISILELLVPLAVGARVHVAPSGLLRDPGELGAVLRGYGITVLQATPTSWRLLLDSDAPLPPGLRMFSGGEPLTPDVAARLSRAGGELWNLYGPTEATVWCSAKRIDPEAPTAITIGTPLAGTQMMVIEDDGVAPTGVVGELCIAGPALARGYRNRPDLTADRFGAARLDGTDVRIYRTGDLARRLPDGEFECLGRNDLQVKIDGYRIELGEIERALVECGDVRQAFVTVDEAAAGGERQLVAHVLPQRDAFDATAIRDALARTLPPYMVPARFRQLRELPLTDNGKVDRRRLHAAGQPVAGRVSGTPRSPTEAALLALWRELLGRDDIGVDDDYFAAGGRSLTAARMFARIETQLGRRLPLASLLEATTVAQLAALIDRKQEPEWRPLVCLQGRGPGAPLFLVHPLGGNVVTYRWLVRELGVQRPIFGLQSAGLDGVQAPRMTVEEMAAAYCAEILRACPAGPYLIAGASFGGLVALEITRLLQRSGREVRFLGMFDTEHPDVPRWLSPRLYARSPLFRFFVYPHLQRVRAHAGRLREYGPRRYWTDVVRQRVPPALAIAVDEPREQHGAGAVPEGLTRVVTANTRAERRYWPQRCGGAITFFRSATARFSPDRRNWWREVSPDVRYIDVPGSHYSMRLPPHVSELARALARELDAIDASATRVA